jgi:hypothetical protein
MAKDDKTDKSDLSALFESGMDGLNDSLKHNRGDDGEKKLFGLPFLKMDGWIVSAFEGFYQAIIGQAGEVLGPKTYGAILHGARKHLNITNQTSLNRLAAGGALTANVLLYAAPHIGDLVEQVHQQHEERKDFARSIAPVLRDLKGHASISSLLSVRESDNEAIYVHRRRMMKVAHTRNIHSTLGLFMKIGPNLLREGDHARSLVNGKMSREFERQQGLLALKQQQDKLINEKRDTLVKTLNWNRDPADITFEHLTRYADNKDGYGSSYGRRDSKLVEEIKRLQPKPEEEKRREGWIDNILTTANTVMPTIVNKANESSERKIERAMQQRTAVDYIVELEKQVPGGPDSSSFTTPDGQPYSLEKYIAATFIQHQKNMAELDPKRHTQIREALQDDLEKAVAPIAKAIREGDMSAMSLVRLVGESMTIGKKECRIIKDQGRAIADPETVEAMVRQFTRKAPAVAHTDPQELFSESSYTQDDLKTVFGILQGEERLMFASMFSDEVLQAVGLSEKEVKEVRDHTQKEAYEHMLAELIAAVPTAETGKLKQDGLGEKEIAKLSDAQNAVGERGTGAIHEFKSSPINAHGIEETLANFIVSKVKGDKTYFGTLRAHGKEQLASLAQKPAKEEVGAHTGALNHGADEFAAEPGR